MKLVLVHARNVRRCTEVLGNVQRENSYVIGHIDNGGAHETVYVVMGTILLQLLRSVS